MQTLFDFNMNTAILCDRIKIHSYFIKNIESSQNFDFPRPWVTKSSEPYLSDYTNSKAQLKF